MTKKDNRMEGYPKNKNHKFVTVEFVKLLYKENERALKSTQHW